MAEEQWIDFQESKPETHPTDGVRVQAELSNGKRGPATYFAQTGFTLFNLPWGDGAPVTKWQLWNWPDA